MDTSSHMRAARFSEFGGPEVVRIENVPVPRCEPGEVLVEVRAAGFNHLDLWVRRGIPIETTMPHIGGSDISGVIAATGPHVEDWKVGDEVLINPALSCRSCEFCVAGEEPLCPKFKILGEHTNGGFADFVAAPASNLHPKPTWLSFEEAACLPISYQTAWRALFSRARLKPGDDVLIIGASGGTAIAALQLASIAGANVFAITSGPENVQRVRQLGANFVYDRQSDDLDLRIAEDTGKRGVDVVVENVGLPTWSTSIRALRNGGCLVTYGATAGPRVEIDIRRLFWKQIEIIGTTMASHREFADMMRAIETARLHPIVDRVMPLSAAAEAHEHLENGRQFGKVVLTPDG